jgi:hypothetical protein
MGTACQDVIRRNDPCWLTDDLYRFIRIPVGWSLDGYTFQWMAASPKSRVVSGFLELQYQLQDGDHLFDYEALEDFQFSDWNKLWIDTTSYGEYDQYVKVIAMLEPATEYLKWAKAGGFGYMSMMSMKPDAIKHKCALVHSNETYPTDFSQVLHQCKHAIRQIRDVQPGETIRILDLCAGPTTYGEVAKKMLNKLGYEVELVAIEIDPGFFAPDCVDLWIGANALEIDLEELGVFHLILSNPPFSLAGELAIMANKVRLPGGVVSFLLSANFPFSGKDQVREDLFAQFPHFHEIKLLRRPSFLAAYSAEMLEYFKKRKINPNGTAAQAYVVLEWAGASIATVERAYWPRVEHHFENWVTEMRLRGNMVICGLIREAADERRAAEREGREEYTCYDDRFSKLAAQTNGWAFYRASPLERDNMRFDEQAKAMLKAMKVRK